MLSAVRDADCHPAGGASKQEFYVDLYIKKGRNCLSVLPALYEPIRVHHLVPAAVAFVVSLLFSQALVTLVRGLR